jgi:hypothetical protein
LRVGSERGAEDFGQTIIELRSGSAVDDAYHAENRSAQGVIPLRLDLSPNIIFAIYAYNVIRHRRNATLNTEHRTGRRVLYVEGNVDGTIGGSFFSLLFLATQQQHHQESSVDARRAFRWVPYITHERGINAQFQPRAPDCSQ